MTSSDRHPDTNDSEPADGFAGSIVNEPTASVPNLAAT